MKQKDVKFKIGDVVTGIEVMERKTLNLKVTWVKKQREHFVGVVCGMIRRYDGTLRSYDVDEPYYLTDTKGHIFYQVKLGWINKPLLVLEDQIVITSRKFILPVFHVSKRGQSRAIKTLWGEYKNG